MPSDDYYVNLAVHDAEDYEGVYALSSGNPPCPLCGGEMFPASEKDSNIVWNCVAPRRRCTLIEGKWSRRRGLLWDCRYEPSPMRKP